MNKITITLMIASVIFLLACQPVSKKAVKEAAPPATAEETEVSQELSDLDDLDKLVQETDDELGLDELEQIEVE
ncbi:MAG: hypothetical protein AABX13_02695 [Nanoarchaeota archaeon]